MVIWVCVRFCSCEGQSVRLQSAALGAQPLQLLPSPHPIQRSLQRVGGTLPGPKEEDSGIGLS